MEAGEFRHRIALQRPEYAQDQNTGEMALSWVTVQTVWAAIKPMRGKEFIASHSNQSQVNTEIFIRFRTDIEPTWRMVHMVNGAAGTIYNIAAVMPDRNSGREHLRMQVSSGVNDGE